MNSSDWNFTPDAQAIRFGLGAIKNVGQSAVEAIRVARQEVGKFRSIYEFCEKVDMGAVNKRMVESFIKAGAMDELEGTRSQLFAAVDSAIECGQSAWKDRLSGQVGLFAADFAAEEHPEKPLPKVPDWLPKDKLTYEKELLGFYITGHPLDQYRDKVKDLATHDSSNLEGLAKGVEVALCGVLTTIQRKRNRESKPWASMQLEDLTGSVEALLFTTQYERLAPMLEEDRAVLIRGLVLPEENAPPKISVQEIVPLDVARVPLPSLISIKVRLGKNGGVEPAAELQKLFQEKPGETEVRFRLELPRDFPLSWMFQQRCVPTANSSKPWKKSAAPTPSRC